jgi:hypothetical protein
MHLNICMRVLFVENNKRDGGKKPVRFRAIYNKVKILNTHTTFHKGEAVRHISIWVPMCLSHFNFRTSFRFDGNGQCTTGDRREKSRTEIFSKYAYAAYYIRNIAYVFTVPNILKLRNFEVRFGTFYIENIYTYYWSSSEKEGILYDLPGTTCLFS